MMIPFFSLGMSGLVYAVLLPLLILPVFAMLFFPSMQVPGARSFAIGKAIYCHVLMALGLLLMTVSALPALYAVCERLLTGQDRFSTEIYVALLLLFAAGGLTFLWHESKAMTIDEPSRRVVGTVFWFLWKTVGYLLMLIAVMAFFLTMLLTRESFAGTWWIMPVLLFVYGGLLSWITRLPAPVSEFRSAPMVTSSASMPMKTAVAAKKAVAKPMKPPVKAAAMKPPAKKN